MKKLALKNIRGQIGRRLDSEEQRTAIIAKLQGNKHVMDRQKEMLLLLPKTRRMPQFSEVKSPIRPGPDTYSMEAAMIKKELHTKGADRRTTVDLARIKGDRLSFALPKNRNEYKLGYAHKVQYGDAPTYLSEHP